jgi:DNA-binding LacI/PurR family transcriptional regulator
MIGNVPFLTDTDQRMKSRPTIIDVARLAGVSKTTVARVVNGELENVSEKTLQKVQQAIQELGYIRNTVASSLRTERTNIVMLMIPDITNPFWPEVARGIQDLMGREGYSVVFANNDWNGEQEVNYLGMARRNRLDGLLINPIRVTQEAILAAQIPAVIMGLREGYPEIDMVGSDSYGATQKALEYLTRLGHQRIGLLLGQSVYSSVAYRFSSYADFFEHSGIAVDEALVVPVSFDNSGGVNGMRQLLELDKPPTAVLASNDLIAIGALHVAAEMGYRIPEDISIMGIDDIYAASVTIPPLTTVRKQKYELGCQAARLLLDRIQSKGPPEPQKVKIPCQLVVRGSTGRAVG